MFSFFRKKPADAPAPAAPEVPAPDATAASAPASGAPVPAPPPPTAGQAAVGFLKRVFVPGAASPPPADPLSDFAPLSGPPSFPPVPPLAPAPVPSPVDVPPPVVASPPLTPPAFTPPPVTAPPVAAPPVAAPTGVPPLAPPTVPPPPPGTATPPSAAPVSGTSTAFVPAPPAPMPVPPGTPASPTVASPASGAAVPRSAPAPSTPAVPAPVSAPPVSASPVPPVTPGPGAPAPGSGLFGATPPPPPAESGGAFGWLPAWARPGSGAPAAPTTPTAPPVAEAPAAPAPAPDDEVPRAAWFQRLRKGLARTGSSLAQVFTGTRIDEALYEELEAALLMADAGVRATEYLLDDLKRRVKDAKATDPAAVKGLLADGITDLLRPLERGLEVGRHVPTVIMVAGVNGAGKTTSIGKLTRHLAAHRCKVLLAAADTFRAAAREQLEVWADRNQVEIVSQAGGDPASVTFDAVNAGRARGCDVVIADTAGRLPTQLHLMEELKKIRRVITKADATAPHEVLLVVDGNTGQNALEQVKSFDAALGLTGLVVTKLDGTAKGGVLAAIALWSRDRARDAGTPVIPVYFIGVGEKLEDLQTFDAREFAQALLD